MGKLGQKKMSFSLAAHTVTANNKQVRTLLNKHLSPAWKVDQVEVDRLLEAARAETLGSQLTELLKRDQFKDMQAKCHALINFAKKSHYQIAVVQHKSHPAVKAGILKQSTTATHSRSNSATSASSRVSIGSHGGGGSQMKIAGKKILAQSVVQFNEEGAEPDQAMPQLQNHKDIKPGAHGIILLTGPQLQQSLYGEGRTPENYLEYSAPLIALVPAERFEKHLGSNEAFHESFAAYRADIVIEDSSSKAGVRPIMVWVVNLSKTKVQAKPLVPKLQLKVKEQVEIEMQIKKGVVSEELFKAIQAAPEKEASEMARVILDELLLGSKGVYKAFEHKPAKFKHTDPKKALAKTGLISAFLEVATDKVKQCMAKSGEHGVFFKFPGPFEVHPWKADIVPLEVGMTAEEARGFVMGKLGGYELGLTPIRSDWTRFGLRVDADHLLAAQQKLTNGESGPGDFPIRLKYVIDHIPRGTDLKEMIEDIERRLQWKLYKLKEVVSEQQGCIALLVGAVEEPKEMIIPLQKGSLVIRQAGKKPAVKPAGWTIRPNLPKPSEANAKALDPLVSQYSRVGAILARMTSPTLDAKMEVDSVSTPSSTEPATMPNVSAASPGIATSPSTGASGVAQELNFRTTPVPESFNIDGSPMSTKDNREEDTHLTELDEEQLQAAACPLRATSGLNTPNATARSSADGRGAHTPQQRLPQEPDLTPVERMMANMQDMMEQMTRMHTAQNTAMQTHMAQQQEASTQAIAQQNLQLVSFQQLNQQKDEMRDQQIEQIRAQLTQLVQPTANQTAGALDPAALTLDSNAPQSGERPASVDTATVGAASVPVPECSKSPQTRRGRARSARSAKPDRGPPTPLKPRSRSPPPKIANADGKKEDEIA